jgi:hypothetical protein
MHIADRLLRDGRCAGDNDGLKYTWNEARTMCMKHGWRLCYREELNLPGSASCCSRIESVDRCGYDSALVWTNNQGGMQPMSEEGRLNSNFPLMNATQMSVDLGKLQVIRGIQIQGVLSVLKSCTT